MLVLAFGALPAAAQVTLSTSPTRVIGQDSLTISSSNPNLVEGREFDTPLGIALDTSANPPHLYVADTGNNRVLGFANAAAFANGQKADIVIGQADFATTFAAGPQSGRQTGMTEPVGLAVDAAGNLYVVDAGNNRVLRFPKPFSQTSILPDMVIGQADFTTATPNLNGIGPSTLEFNPGSGALTAYLAFDASGNLWVADAGNNRVLRFNASALSKGTSGAAADLVIGQANFTSNGVSGYTLQSVTITNEPTGVAFDSTGNLFVSESLGGTNGRILVYPAPQSSNEPASRIAGAPTTPPSGSVNNLQIASGSGALGIVNDQVLIADSANHRILVFPPVAQWGTDLDSQPASSAIGQADLNSGSVNAGQPDPSASSLQSPAAVAFSGSELFIADTNNYRVLVMPVTGSTFGAATRVLGQDGLNFGTVNLIEGREFNFTTVQTGGAGDAGIVIDSSSTPPHLYVADPYNNRVLAYKNLSAAKAGSKADLVIGQPDFQHSDINYPSNSTSSPNQSGLNAPIGLAVDVNGNLYVADTGNSRVLRFPAPFTKAQNLPNADIVLGQQNFTLKITDASASTLSAPYGLAFAGDNGLLVSDRIHNRVLFFSGSAALFQSGQAASQAFGQPDFTTTSAGNTADKLSAPRHISTDSAGRLYVADTGNARISIFDVVTNAGPGSLAAIELSGLNAPNAVFVNQSTGEIWVANTYSEQIFRFPSYDNLALQNLQPDYLLPEQALPIALTQDASGALYVADSANRVIVFYPGIAGLNAANFLGPCIASPCNILAARDLAPGAIMSLFSLSGQASPFGSATAAFSSVPVPTTLGDLQVTVNDTPAPLFYVGPSQINLVIPIEAPTSGTATVQVIRASTGQVLGSTLLPMAPASPGLFTEDASGSGQVAAINQDGSLNGPSHPAPWGTYVSFYGTGSGVVPNQPPDGVPPSGALSTSTAPQVVIGNQYVPAGNIQYSGLAPGLVGVWQLNVKIPNTVVPTTTSSPTPVFFQFDSVFSGGPLFGRAVTMWVRSN